MDQRPNDDPSPVDDGIGDEVTFESVSMARSELRQSLWGAALRTGLCAVLLVIVLWFFVRAATAFGERVSHLAQLDGLTALLGCGALAAGFLLYLLLQAMLLLVPPLVEGYLAERDVARALH